MPREIIIPNEYEIVEEGEFKGCAGLRCHCGRLIVFGNAKALEELEK